MSPPLWWERFPGRLEFELEALAAAGYSPVLEDAAKAAGVVRVALEAAVGGMGKVALTATFPDLYPYFRPEVAAPDLSLPHHQHPFAKNLCLLGRATNNWSPTDTLAALLLSQLDAAVGAGLASPPAGSERDALPEERQAEPFSDYYSYAPNVMCLIDGAWKLPAEATHGTLEIRFRGSRLPSNVKDAEAHTLGLVAQVRDQAALVIADAPEQLMRRFPHGGLQARWSRLATAVPSDVPSEIWAAAEAADLGGVAPTSRSQSGSNLQVRAVVFPEEVAWRESGDGWLFVVREPSQTVDTRPSKKRRVPAGRRTTPAKDWLVRAGRAGPTDLRARMPALAGLAECRAALVGAGALGGTIAAQLARAGIGGLHIIDRDTLDPGNTVRHAGPFMQSGRLKAVVAGAVAHDHQPYLDCHVSDTSIGQVRMRGEGVNDAEAIDTALRDAHILLDASAELGVQHFLADEAMRQGIPYLCVSATNGAWGGLVTLIVPGHTEGCWLCLQQHMKDGTIPPPPDDPAEFVQPPGCANPTFTGAGFDLDMVAIHAVRVAAAALLHDDADAYHALTPDVSVLALREPDGTPILPTWTGHALTRHPECLAH
jgi:molybdopterin/thiamine biosynthesis adenylyltransferase